MNWQANALQSPLAPLLPGFVVEVLATVDSTNSELMRRARAGNTAPVLLVAESQTAGRGRQGREWHSDLGDSLTFSLGLQLAPRDWSGLSLAVGVAVAESLDPAGRSGIALKWPNDLWISRPGSDRKLAGILVETVSGLASLAPAASTHTTNPDDGRPGSSRYAVIGVGINIAPRSSNGLAVRPACLLDLVAGMDAPQALHCVVPALVAAIQGFEALGFAPFQARFEVRDALRDRAVVLSDGTTGTAHGVNENGGLLVHTAQGMQTITRSEVSVRPLAPL